MMISVITSLPSPRYVFTQICLFLTCQKDFVKINGQIGSNFVERWIFGQGGDSNPDVASFFRIQTPNLGLDRQSKFIVIFLLKAHLKKEKKKKSSRSVH